jgi:2-polyprenyl-3-methyl-5-hydroxy-6-metoxy-1,4-benzoquinol methylase
VSRPPGTLLAKVIRLPRTAASSQRSLKQESEEINFMAPSPISPREASDRDKAGKEYWDQLHAPDRTLGAINPRDTSLRNYIACQFHSYFEKTLSSMNAKEVLEVGCGGSEYLPYFAKEFGLHVTGMDYSEPGCASAARLLTREGIAGTIVCADFFDPPRSLCGKFDVVVSFGVVEHFRDTPDCIAAIANFVKPGGLVLTFVPNMTGVMGSLQKAIDRQLFNKHVPLNRELLRRAHELAGLIVQECDYFIFNNFFILGVQPTFGSPTGRYLKALLLRCLHYFSGAIWTLERVFHRFPPIGFTSPYIVCAARTSGSQEETGHGQKM